ncbi:MAG TPA: HAMP domain-containing sensor histidine kinase, partial [Candidatus Kapabacteria bacterium]
VKPGLLPAEISSLIAGHRRIGESVLLFDIFEMQGPNIVPILLQANDAPRAIIDEIKTASGPLRYSSSRGPMRIIILRTPVSIIAAAYSTIALEEAEESVIEVFAYYLLGGLLLAAIGGIILSRYLIGPIESLAGSAKEIVREPERTRLPETSSIAEIADVARSINALLEARERALEQQRNFAADAAHELRTPLTVLKGEIEVELRMAPDGEQAELLRSNLEEIERLIDIVQDLLELAEIESGEKEREEICSLHSALTSAALRLRSLADEKHVEIIVPETELQLVAQERRIMRLVYNLLLNAVQHSNRGGTVTVVLVEAESESIMAFEDTGRGIAPEKLEHLFERFYRAGNEEKRGGAGLGLAIVKSIADRYGLTLSVRSNPGLGTVVSLTIPHARQR